MVTNETYTNETYTNETYTKETEMTEKNIKEHEVEPEGKPISNLDKCDICMEDFTLNRLRFCGNSVKDGETECKYKMCDDCLLNIKRKLENKCPQCRNTIEIDIPDNDKVFKELGNERLRYFKLIACPLLAMQWIGLMLALSFT